MYVRPPDEAMPQSASAPSPFSVQLYPYHQQAFRQRYGGPHSPAVPHQDSVEPQWPHPPPSRLNQPQPRPRPPYPSVSTSLPPIHDNHQSALYASPQSQYQGNPPMLPNPTRYSQEPLPLHSHKPFGAPVGGAHRLSTLPTHIHPQVPHPNSSGTVPYTNHSAPGQYPSPSHNQPPQRHNHHTATVPFPQPSSVDHAPRYSPPSAASSIGLQPVPRMPSPPPMFQEDQWKPVEEKSRPPDNDDIAMALEMSQAEMLRRRTEEEKLSSQEEEELARAMAESLQMSNQTSHLFGGESSASEFVSQPASLYKNNEDLSPLQLPITLPTEAPSYASASSSSQNTNSFVEDTGSNAQNWQMPAAYQEGSSSAGQNSPSMPSAPSYPTETPPQDRVDPSDNLPVYSDRLSSSLAAMESLQTTDADESRLVFDDEAYARQLLADEEDDLRRRIEQKRRMETERQQQSDADRLPQYTSSGLLSPDVPAGESSGSSRLSSNANEAPQPMPSQPMPSQPMPSQSMPVQPMPVQPMPSQPMHPQTPSSSSQVTSHDRPTFPAIEQHPPLQTVNSGMSISSAQSSQTGRPGINQHGNQPRPHTNSMSSAVAGPSNVGQLNRNSSAGVLNPSHFLDSELLNGVSIGFKPPAPSLKLKPMEDPMPNIITLPSKKCPPLHFQAPSWSHMLRLLFRLTNTRIEPTIEAMSDTKAALKLRTVIQFVLPSPQAVDVWRTILWFTIDQPVPPNALGAARYTCGNPNVLPWSYTLSPLPGLLRGASDTAMSKTYTIPATAIPFPSLPITFPNLALYLIAVLDESRKHSRPDALAGVGKLGKMVQMAYPSVKEEDDDDGQGRSTVADLFKRVIGRGGKDKKKGRANNETYQMVIPFVSDGWG